MYCVDSRERAPKERVSQAGLVIVVLVRTKKHHIFPASQRLTVNWQRPELAPKHPYIL